MRAHIVPEEHEDYDAHASDALLASPESSNDRSLYSSYPHPFSRRDAVDWKLQVNEGWLAEMGPQFIDFQGCRVERDEGSWHFVLLFPLIPPGTHAPSSLRRRLTPHEAQEKVHSYFHVDVLRDKEFDYLHLDDIYRHGDVTKRELHDAVRMAIALLLAGPHMGMMLEGMESIDQDELFLKARLVEGERVEFHQPWFGSWFRRSSKKQSYNTIEQIADSVHLRLQLNPSKYPRDQPCPTKEVDERRAFIGSDFVPGSLLFHKRNSEYFANFTELDMLRICRLRVGQFLNIDKMVADGVLNKNPFFMVHQWDAVSSLCSPKTEHPPRARVYPQGWACLHATSFLQWPGDQHLEHVRNYLGAEIAFFFHWLNFFSRSLIIPAAISPMLQLLLILAALEVLSKTVVSICVYVYVTLLMIWSVLFGPLYEYKMNSLAVEWGTRNHRSDQDQPRAVFDKRKVGTLTEKVRCMLHWLLVLLLLVWTSAFYVILDRIIGTGVLGVDVFIGTANMVVVDLLFGIVSPILSIAENHRTNGELRTAIRTKLFIEKLIVVYCPLWYVAFIINPPRNPGTSKHLLVIVLLVFMLLRLTLVILGGIARVVMTRSLIRRELRRSKDKTYTYLQAQAKCPTYTNHDDIRIFMQLITSMGLVMQFSAVLPVIPCLQLLSNMFEVRILAFKLCNVYRRSDCRSAAGIGEWVDVIRRTTWISLVINIALLAFYFPNKLEDNFYKIIAFAIGEHAVFGFKALVDMVLPRQNSISKLIETHNISVAQNINQADNDSVFVRGPGHVPNMRVDLKGSPANVDQGYYRQAMRDVCGLGGDVCGLGGRSNDRSVANPRRSSKF